MQLVPKTRAAMEAQLELLEDDKFYRQFLYFFELRIPGKAMLGGFSMGASVFMPLMLAPQAYTVSDPFTVQVTPGLGGALTVEENGVLARTIRISGTTGFSPKLMSSAPFATDLVRTEQLSFSMRGEVPWALPLLSGPRQFQLLQDRVFRLYGDLKRNPDTSADTELYWHNVKDDEHWRVIPLGFAEARGRVTYRYVIDLLAVEPADAFSLDTSEDRSLLQQIGDAARSVREAIDVIKGTIDNVTGLVRDIDNAVRNFVDSVGSFTSILTSVNELVDAAEDLVGGVTDVITVPFSAAAALVNTVGLLVDGLDQMVQGGLGVAGIFSGDLPPSVQAELADLERGVHRILVHPDLFETPAERQARRVRERGAVGSDEATFVSSTMATAMTAGTRPGPGDATKARGERSSDPTGPRGSAVGTVRLGQGQTLQDVAAAVLGDPSRWEEIAALNGLVAPYTHPAGLPNVARPGDLLLVPTDAPSPKLRPVVGVLGTSLLDPEPVRLFGTDWKLEAVPGGDGQYDLVLDEGINAKKDLMRVRGVENLEQGIGVRLRTERGSDGLYPSLGVMRTLGTGADLVDREVLKIRYAEAVRADPRIVRVSRLTLSGPTDVAEVEMNAVVYGLTERITVKTRS